MDIAPALALVTIAALVTFSPAARVPIGILAGMYVLHTHTTIALGALLAAIGVTLARIALALLAKRPTHLAKLSPKARANEEAMHAWLGSNPHFIRVSFLMGALPFVPSRMTFPVLGAIGAPLRWAVLGSLCGSTLVLCFTTWLSTTLAVAFAGRNQAAALLGLVALTIAILRILGSIDAEAWRTEHKLRMREEKSPFNVNLFGPGAGAGFGSPHTPTGAKGEDEGELYEGEVVGEEIIDDADDQPGNGDELPRGDS